MKFKSTTLSISSKEKMQLIDITDGVLKYVQKTSFSQGLINITTQHTTTSVCINESCEALEKDLIIFFKKLAQPEVDYEHNYFAKDGRPNAHSHLLSYIVGGTQTIPIIDHKLQLGKWQRIFFVELDGPREDRHVVLSAMGVSHGSD